MNGSHYTAESLPLTSVHAAAPASNWSSKLRSPFVVAAVLAVFAVVVALALGGSGGGASPSATAPMPGLAADAVVGGGAGQGFEVVDHLDAQIRELEEQMESEVMEPSSAESVRLDADFFDTLL